MSDNINTIDRVTIRGVTYYLRDNSVINGTPTGLPPVSAQDEGAILRVTNGAWQIVQIASAEEGAF